MKTIGIVGGGIMGSGIAQVAAQAKFSVILVEKDKALAQKALQNIDRHLSKAVEKGALRAEEKPKILSRITVTTDWKLLSRAVVVIEAVPEILDLKKEIFRKLDELTTSKTILASNTSSLSVTEIAAVTRRPAQVIGMHFMNPAPVMPLVEIIKGIHTSKSTLNQIQTLARQFGKTPVVAKDSPGFISNRILAPMLNEAIFCLQEGVGSKKDIDTVMKLGMRHPMGPLELADTIGLDTLLSILNVLYSEFKDPKYRPAPLLTRMVQAGLLGRKTGEGFYKYK